MRKLLALLLFCITTQVGLGRTPTTRYVSLSTNTPAGSNSNTGGIGDPLLTVKRCIELSSAGDECVIRGITGGGRAIYVEHWSYSFDGMSGRTQVPVVGTSWVNAFTIRNYTGEQIELTAGEFSYQMADLTGPAGADLTSSNPWYWIIKGDSRSNFLIKGTQPAVCQNAISVGYVDYVRLQSLTVQDWAETGIAGSGTYWDFLDLEVKDNAPSIDPITYYGCGGVQPHGLYFGGRHITVNGSYIHDNGDYQIHFFHSAGCGTSSDNDCLNDNLIENTEVSGGVNGILLATGNRQYAINVISHDSPTSGIELDYRCGDCGILNSTIVGNGGYGAVIGFSAGTTNAHIQNNILYGNGNNTPLDSGTASTVNHNLIGTDPSFTNAGARNYTIPCISAATSYGTDLTSLSITAVLTDFLGAVRTRWDAGAYEPSCGGGAPAARGHDRFHR